MRSRARRVTGLAPAESPSAGCLIDSTYNQNRLSARGGSLAGQWGGQGGPAGAGFGDEEEDVVAGDLDDHAVERVALAGQGDVDAEHVADLLVRRPFDPDPLGPGGTALTH